MLNAPDSLVNFHTRTRSTGAPGGPPLIVVAPVNWLTAAPTGLALLSTAPSKPSCQSTRRPRSAERYDRNGSSVCGTPLKRMACPTSSTSGVLGRAVHDPENCIQLGQLPLANVDEDVRLMHAQCGNGYFKGMTACRRGCLPLVGTTSTSHLLQSLSRDTSRGITGFGAPKRWPRWVGATRPFNTPDVDCGVPRRPCAGLGVCRRGVRAACR